MADSRASTTQTRATDRASQKGVEEDRLAFVGNNKSLQAFVDPQQTFGEHEAYDLSETLKPGVSVSADTVLQLRKVTFSETNEFIEYRFLKPWLRGCLRVLATSDEMSDEDMKELATTRRDSSIRIQGVLASAGNNENASLEAVARLVVEYDGIARPAQVRMMMEYYGAEMDPQKRAGLETLHQEVLENTIQSTHEVPTKLAEDPEEEGTVEQSLSAQSYTLDLPLR